MPQSTMDDLVFSDYDGMKLCRPCDRWFRDDKSVLQHLVHSNSHDYCERCDREFVNCVAKNQHIANSNNHNLCHLQVCRDRYYNGADFLSYRALLDHFKVEEDHHFCFSCRSDFDSDAQRRQHWEHSVDHFICLKCNDSFNSNIELQQHYEEKLGHFACSKCGFFSYTQDTLNIHLETSNNHHWCARCSRDFISDTALLQHRQSSPLHFLCQVCKQDFSCSNELTQHQKIHQPRSIRCACPLTFACFSALAIHWEAGKCTTNRQHLNKLILKFPEHRHFTVLEYIDNLSGAADRIRESDDNNFNYYSRELTCPIEGCESGFRSLDILNQHLCSPYHDVNAFKCPNTDCDARFSCLSGLLQHVENAKSCPETINHGTGCLGRLWLFLLERFNMLP